MTYMNTYNTNVFYYPQPQVSQETVIDSNPLIPFIPSKVPPIYWNSLDNISNFLKEYKKSTNDETKRMFREYITQEFTYIQNEIDRYFALYYKVQP